MLHLHISNCTLRPHPKSHPSIFPSSSKTVIYLCKISICRVTQNRPILMSVPCIANELRVPYSVVSIRPGSVLKYSDGRPTEVYTIMTTKTDKNHVLQTMNTHVISIWCSSRVCISYISIWCSPHVASISTIFYMVTQCIKHLQCGGHIPRIQYLPIPNQWDVWEQQSHRLTTFTFQPPFPTTLHELITSSCLHMMRFTQRGAFLQAVRAPNTSSS